MQSQTPSTLVKERPDFLDVLLILTKNIKLLVLTPLVVGLVALGIAYLLPRSYVSNAIIAIPVGASASAAVTTPQQAASIMVSPVVLDPVIDTLKLTPDLSRDLARNALAERVKTSVGKDLLVRLEVIGPSPEEAQQTANTVLDAWLRSTVPSDREKADLKQKLSHASAALAHVQRALTQLVVENPAGAGPAGRKEGTLSLVAIGELGDRYLDQVLGIPRQMEGLSREVIKQPPTLPTQAVRPKKALIAILATVLTAAALMSIIMLRHLLDAAALDPRRAEKLRRLRNALSWSGRKGSDRADV
jgi:capsular polysaccharide biosynthesis protein